MGVVWTFLLSSILSQRAVNPKTNKPTNYSKRNRPLPYCYKNCRKPRDWLVGFFVLNGPLRQYFNLYRAVSQRRGDRKEKRQMREKMSKQTPRGWSGGAMVLDKLPGPGRPTSLDKSRARAYCTCSRCGWGLFGHFYSHLSFLFSFSLSLGDDPI